jgi:actin-like ATPase involved in cell morphogenesis
MYELGIDLGTTFTAAAVRRGERIDIVPLGSRGPVIPSVVFLGADDTVLAGEAAQRRALTEPTRVAREFKRRLGDPLPIIVAGVPHSAESLSAQLLRAVVAEVTKLEGGPPTRVALTHPANWGAYKKDLYAQAVRFADLPDVVFLTEPEAAAIHYASQERVEDGSVVAVYDLGGGTFDATILRKMGEGFEVLGQPEGIERLGGIDFDEAVFAHVLGALGVNLEELDRSDPAVLSGVARLRQECVEAKEALSADTEASIPIALPGLHTEVRLTRPELEAMLRRPIADTVASLRRALRDAAVEPEDLSTILLVGGSSRIPMVAEMVGADLGRPVAVDAHPKYAIASGAARYAGIALAAAPAPAPVAAPPAAPAPGPAAAPVVEVPPAAPAPAPLVVEAPAPTPTPVVEPAPIAAAAPSAPPPLAPPVPSPQPRPEQPSAEQPRPEEPRPEQPSPEQSSPEQPSPERTAPIPVRPASQPARSGPSKVVIGGIAAAVLVIAGIVGALALGGGGGDGGDGGGNAGAGGDGCPDEGPFICLLDASVSGGQVVAQFRTVGTTLGSQATASFFLESAPASTVLWDTPDPFQTAIGDVASDARLCALLNGNGGPATGTGNCVAISG